MIGLPASCAPQSVTRGKKLKVSALLRLAESHAALAARPQGDRVPAPEADAARPGRL